MSTWRAVRNEIPELEDNSESTSVWKLQPDPSGRAACKGKCKCKIPKGSLRISYTFDDPTGGDRAWSSNFCLRPECLAANNTNAGTHMLGNKARGKMLRGSPDAPVDMPGFDSLAPDHKLCALTLFGCDVDNEEHMADVVAEFPELEGSTANAAPLETGIFPPLNDTQRESFGLSNKQIAKLGPDGRKVADWELEGSKPIGAAPPSELSEPSVAEKPKAKTKKATPPKKVIKKKKEKTKKVVKEKKIAAPKTIADIVLFALAELKDKRKGGSTRAGIRKFYEQFTNGKELSASQLKKALGSDKVIANGQRFSLA